METVNDGCPTGILIDVEPLKNLKDNEKTKVSTKNKEKNIFVDTKSSHSWSSSCLLDQSPQKPPSILKKNVFVTPKSNWKTPSPKSMKIISRDASRIVKQLYASPINCAEVMICDEVFPAVKSLDDDAYYDENHVKSRNPPAMDMAAAIADVKVDQSDPNLLDLTKCKVSAISCCSSENVVTSDEKLSATVLQSDMNSVKQQDSISEKATDTVTPENASTSELCAESVIDNETIDSITSIVNSSSTFPECIDVSSDKCLAPESEVITPKELTVVAKGCKFKKSTKDDEKNKENVVQSKGTIQAKYSSRYSNAEKSFSSSGNRGIEPKTGNKILSSESMVEQSSKKYSTTKCPLLEKKKAKENQNLEDNLSKSMIGKPKMFQPNSNVVRSQSLLYKKDPLYKTTTLLETPNVESSVRRFHSFNTGSTRKAIPTVGKKSIPTTDSSCRILKPKNFNPVSNNGNGFSTPLQFRCSENTKLASSYSANPTRRKSLAFNANQSLVASGIKVAPQKDQLSVTKKPAVTSISSKFRFEKKLTKPSPHPKLKSDSLPRKLFP